MIVGVKYEWDRFTHTHAGQIHAVFCVGFLLSLFWLLVLCAHYSVFSYGSSSFSGRRVFDPVSNLGLVTYGCGGTDPPSPCYYRTAADTHTPDRNVSRKPENIKKYVTETNLHDLQLDRYHVFSFLSFIWSHDYGSPFPTHREKNHALANHNYEIKSPNYDFKSLNYDLKCQNYDIQSWNWQKVKIMTLS